MEVYAKPIILQSIGHRTVLKLYMGRGGEVELNLHFSQKEVNS